MSLPAISLAERFYMSRKGGTGGGVWVHPKGETAWLWKAPGRQFHLAS